VAGERQQVLGVIDGGLDVAPNCSGSLNALMKSMTISAGFLPNPMRRPKPCFW
jgi:hypothetical protein